MHVLPIRKQAAHAARPLERRPPDRASRILADRESRAYA